jgi:hypothetical protein
LISALGGDEWNQNRRPNDYPGCHPSRRWTVLLNGINQRLIGKIVLVGITRRASDGTTIKSHGQYHGKIVRADRGAGIAIECEGIWSGETITLPPMTGAFHPVNSGEYRLRSTGEIIKDPDVLTTWSIIEPAKS